MNKVKIQWEFSPIGGGMKAGGNSPAENVFDTYETPVKLTRESLQNVVDAAEDSSKAPAIAEFSSYYIKPKDIPGIEKIKHVYLECAEYWNDKDDIHKDSDIVKHYNNLYNLLDRDSDIRVLKISDFNTVGLDRKGYYKLFDSIGYSGKEKGKGGSFGLGKSTYFSSSKYKIVFTSSKAAKGEEYRFAGKTWLVAFEDDGKTMQHTGTYGLTDQEPIMDRNYIPNNFVRDKNGTDFYIYGYEKGDNWYEDIIKAVLNFFWLAIYNKQLVVRIKDKKFNLEISDNNLEKLIYEKFGDIPVNDKNNPIPYYEAVTQGVDPLRHNLSVLGEVYLYIVRKKNFPKKVAYFRGTGMMIEKKSKGGPFGYAAVFVCNNTKGNDILSKMENAEHSEWRVKNIELKGEKISKKIATKAYDELNQFVNNSIESLQGKEADDEIPIPGLDKIIFMPFDDEEENKLGGGAGGNEKKLPGDQESAGEIGAEKKSDGKTLVKKEKVIIYSSPTGIEFEGTKKLVPTITTKKRKKKHPQRTGEEKEESEKKMIILKDIKYRSYAELKGETFIHHIILHGEPNTLISKIVVSIGTDSGEMEKADLMQAYSINKGEELQFKEGEIYDIQLDQNGKEKINVSFAEKDKYSLNIVSYGNK